MIKLRYIMLPILLIIASLGLASCTDGETTATTTPTSTPVTTTQTTTTTPPEYTHQILTTGKLGVNEYSTDMPGQSTILPREYPGAPPFIPHNLSGLVIQKDIHSCFLCHTTGLSFGPDHTATMIPESHYTDILTGTQSDSIQGTRYNCLLCHVQQSLTTTKTTNTTSPTPTATKTTTPATTLTTTWGGLAIAGAQSFSSNCAGCHGSEGAGQLLGPAIIGPNLKSFGTAQGLLNDIQTTMPPNAVSLPNQWYLDILAFILIESGFVQPEDIINSDDLVNVLLNE